MFLFIRKQVLQEIWGSLLTVIGIYICVTIRDGQNDLSFFIREEF